MEERGQEMHVSLFCIPSSTEYVLDGHFAHDVELKYWPGGHPPLHVRNTSSPSSQ